MKRSASALQNSVLVVAHPDDEVLWFSSVLRAINRVIIMFRDYDAVPGLGARRHAAIADLPFQVTCLAIPEVGSFCLADWARPEPSAFGLALRPSAAASDVLRVYQSNFHTIRSALKTELSSARNVFTHNPWGEYGHEDHVQVFRAVDSLRSAIGFNLWVSSYYSARSRPLAAAYSLHGTHRSIRRAVDAAYAERIAGIYKRYGCWTWDDDWVWRREERFITPPRYRSAAGRLLRGLHHISARSLSSDVPPA